MLSGKDHPAVAISVPTPGPVRSVGPCPEGICQPHRSLAFCPDISANRPRQPRAVKPCLTPPRRPRVACNMQFLAAQPSGGIQHPKRKPSALAAPPSWGSPAFSSAPTSPTGTTIPPALPPGPKNKTGSTPPPLPAHLSPRPGHLFLPAAIPHHERRHRDAVHDH